MTENTSHSLSSERVQDLYNRIAKSITSSLEISKIIKAVMEQIELFFKPRNWSLLRVDANTQELFFEVAKGMDPEVMAKLRLKMGEGIAGHVAETGQSMIIKDTKSEEKFTTKVDQLSGFTTKSIIAVPIRFQKKILGVIELINVVDKSYFSQQDLAILETIADFTAIALTNAMTYEQISWIAIHDPLTNLYNRVQLDKLIKSCKEYELLAEDIQISSLMNCITVWIDVDNFKEINDYYDHSMGDEILIKIGNLLQPYCDKDTYAFRVGGDEFLITFLNVDDSELHSKVAQLQEQLSSHSRNILPATGFSFGIAFGKMKNLQGLIKESDNKMYVAKAHNKEKA